MGLGIVTATWSGDDTCYKSWHATAANKAIPSYVVWRQMGVLPSYQAGYEYFKGTGVEVVAFFHDDLELKEQGWDEKVLKEFEDPSVGVVGFGGALRLGSDDIYKVRYHYTQLIRDGYGSNVDDAEVHGERFTGERDVAVLDGFCLIVRRALLDRVGGWPSHYAPHHCYDTWVCLMAHRLHYRVRLVGVRCHHHGGRTATRPEWNEWCATTKWGSDAGMHAFNHRLLYDEFRGVLPVRVARVGSHVLGRER